MPIRGESSSSTWADDEVVMIESVGDVPSFGAVRKGQPTRGKLGGDWEI